MVKHLSTLILSWILLAACQQAEQETGTARNDNMMLEPVRYNNPGLVVDLGVGLWAWPLPMDYDSDGDMDLLVSCPDVSFKGMYFFENKAGKGIKMFLNAKPTDTLTCAEAVDTLYTVAGGTGNLDAAAKINFLVRNGYLSTAADPTNAASTCEQILCQPPAEAYRPGEIIRTEAPDEEKDNPVDVY